MDSVLKRSIASRPAAYWSTLRWCCSLDESKKRSRRVMTPLRIWRKYTQTLLKVWIFLVLNNLFTLCARQCLVWCFCWHQSVTSSVCVADNLYTELGLLYCQCHTIDQSNFQQAVACFSKVQLDDDKRKQVVVWQNLGAVYNCLRDYDRALEYHLKAASLHGRSFFQKCSELLYLAYIWVFFLHIVMCFKLCLCQTRVWMRIDWRVYCSWVRRPQLPGTVLCECCLRVLASRRERWLWRILSARLTGRSIACWSVLEVQVGPWLRLFVYGLHVGLWFATAVTGKLR